LDLAIAMTSTLRLTARALCCALLLALGACKENFDTAEKIGSGKQATQVRALAPFAALELNGPFAIVVTAQGEQAVEVSGDDNLLGEVETLVSGDTLIVRQLQGQGMRIGVQKVVKPLVVHITSDTLRRIRLNGSGNLDLSQFHGDKLELKANGAGDMRLAGRTIELSIENNGSGDIDSRQLTAQRVNARLSGSGDLALANVSAELALEVNGSSDVSAANLRLDHLEATINGSGNIEVDGSSRQVQVKQNGSGDFNACALQSDTVSSLMNGAGDSCFNGTIKNFEAEMRGSGDLELRHLQAETVRLLQAGNGNLRIAGSGGVLHAQLSGSGDFKGRDWQAGRVDLKQSGPGNTDLGTVGETLEIDSQGSGKVQAILGGKRASVIDSGPGPVTLSGSVGLLTVHLSGSGGLDAKGLLANRADVNVKGPGSAVVNVRAKKTTASQTASRIVLVDREGAHQQNQSP